MLCTTTNDKFKYLQQFTQFQNTVLSEINTGKSLHFINGMQCLLKYIALHLYIHQ